MGRGRRRRKGAYKHVFPLKSTIMPTRNCPFSIEVPKKRKIGLKMSGVGRTNLDMVSDLLR